MNMLPRLRTLIKTRQAEAGGAPFSTVLCGDFVSPSILSGMDGGRAMVSALNRLPLNYCCFAILRRRWRTRRR